MSKSNGGVGGLVGLPALNSVYREAVGTDDGPNPTHMRMGRWTPGGGRPPAALDRLIRDYIPRLRQNIENETQLRNLLLSFWRDSEKAEGEA